MEKEKLKDLYKSKIKDFKSNNFLYFEKNDPKISDADFDKLKKEILDLEKKYPYLKNEDSPSKVLGYKPSKNFQKLLRITKLWEVTMSLLTILKIIAWKNMARQMLFWN